MPASDIARAHPTLNIRRQDKWLLIAQDRGWAPTSFIAVCVFLNMGRSHEWIAKALSIGESYVSMYHSAARPFLRKGGNPDQP
jgi:hypothetical protein